MRNLIGKLIVQKFFDHPIIVVGGSRSGTSILLQALGRHPLILAMNGEAPFLTTIGGSAYLFELSDSKKFYLESMKVSKKYLYERLKQMGFEIASGPFYGLLRMLKGLARRHTSPLGKRFWAAKTFPTQVVTEGLIKLYPGIKFIYIIRNGCEVVQSRTKFHSFKDNDFRDQCEKWVRAADKYQHLTELDCVIFVRQEELLSNPQQFFSDITDFLDISSHPGSAAYASSTLVHPLDQDTQEHKSVQEVISSRPSAHADWTEEQKLLFKEICGSTMEKAGYEMPF